MISASLVCEADYFWAPGHVTPKGREAVYTPANYVRSKVFTSVNCYAAP